jgi:hypothetical protein
MGITRFGAGTLRALLRTRVLRGDEPQELHELSGIVEAGEVPECRDGGHGHDKLKATQGLGGFDHRTQAPAFDLLVEFLFNALKSLGVFAHGPDICLEDYVLGGCETNDLGKPSEMGWTPVGAARVADILPKQAGFAPKFRRLEVLHGIFTRPAEIAEGLVLHRRDLDRGKVA